MTLRTFTASVAIPAETMRPARADCHDGIRARVACPVCRGFVPFESRRCPNCLAEFGFHVPSRTMVATSSGTAVIDGQIWIACTKAASLGCNWLVPHEQELDGQQGRCLADSLIRREPDTDDTVAVEKLVSTGIALRRLICQLISPWRSPSAKVSRT